MDKDMRELLWQKIYEGINNPNATYGSLSKEAYKKTNNEILERAKETFDISGKIDTENPIYRFYEKTLGRYLTSKYGAKTVTDSKGVTWYEIPITKEQAKMPVEAFGIVAFPTALAVKNLLNSKNKDEK